jgi:hypothetical protein
MTLHLLLKKVRTATNWTETSRSTAATATITAAATAAADSAEWAVKLE